MRTLILLLLVAILSTSFTNVVTDDLKLEITKVTNAQNNFRILTLKLSNISDQEFNFFTWSCSNQKLFSTNNILIEIPEKKCDKDSILINKLLPNSSEILKLKILDKGKNSKFKITFNCTIIPESKQTRTIQVVSNEVCF